MRRQRDTLYQSKVCEICEETYTPTSGRQRVCMKEACRTALTKTFLSRRVDRYAIKNPRPTEAICQWIGCGDPFPIASTGVIPKFCPPHRKDHVAPSAKAATKKWREQTLDVKCRYHNCENLQHPSGRGWCFFHYPILSVHGLDANAWWNIYEKQTGLCQICLNGLFDGTTIAIDHDHKLAPGPRHDAEHVRGLLHANPCNNVVLGGIETAIANGWFLRALAFIQYPLSESD